MASPFPLDRIFIVGIWIETMLYGMNVVIFIAAMYVLLVLRRGKAPKPLIVASILLFALSTVHVSLVLRQLLEAFIWGEPGTASLYFSEQHKPLPNTKLIVYSLNVLGQDLTLIWRLWVIYDRNWYIGGIFLFLESVHTAAGFVAEARGSIPGLSVFDKILRDWALVNWALDLAVNIGCTALISFRLWIVGRRVRQLTIHGGNKYFGIILSMVESGSIFAMATVVTVILYLSNNVATFAAVDTVAQLATLTPLLIIVRVGFDLTHGRSINTSINTPNISQIRQNSIAGMQVVDPQTEVQVTINKTLESDADDYPLSDISNRLPIKPDNLV